MPCPEMPVTRHHKRSASDIENGPEHSTDSLAILRPPNLPSLSGSMKRMKIHEHDDEGSPSSELFSSFSADRSECGSCRHKFVCNSDKRDDHHANVSISSSSSSHSHSLHPAPVDIVHIIFGQDNQGNNQLHTSILRHNTNTALKLIKQAPSFDYLSIENAEGRTALHLAAVTNQPTLVRSLICAGAAVDAVDDNSKTPLHLACELDYPDVVRCLLRPVDYTETLGNRYTIPFQRIPQNMELTDAEGKTCLALALASKNFNVAKILIDSGAFISHSDLRDMVFDIISPHLADETSHADNVNDDDDNEDEDSKHDTMPLRNRHDESDNGESRGKGKPPFLEPNDHLSDRDLSIVRK